MFSRTPEGYLLRNESPLRYPGYSLYLVDSAANYYPSMPDCPIDKNAERDVPVLGGPGVPEPIDAIDLTPPEVVGGTPFSLADLTTVIDTVANALKENEILLGYGKNSRYSAKWKIELENGKIYTGKDSASLLKALKKIDADGHYIKVMNIKGHGDKRGIYDNKNKGMFNVAGPSFANRPDTANALIDDNIITDILRRTTRAGTKITLDGCSTAEAAKHLARLLPGIKVTGTPIPVVNIPFTRYYFGPFSNYQEPAPLQMVAPK